MAEITAGMVKELREKTDAPMMECKKALTEADGDPAKAEEILRVKLGNKASKAASRVAAEGVVGTFIAPDAKLGAIIEVNCETDFVARNEQFQKLVRDLAIQVAGLRPEYVDRDAIPPEVLESKRTELLADESVRQKPAPIQERIVSGQLEKWFSQVCLLDQPYRDTDITVRGLITDAIATIGENIRVRRFARYELGEEL
jgi:elongation factor Ts